MEVAGILRSDDFELLPSDGTVQVKTATARDGPFGTNATSQAILLVEQRVL